MFDSRPARLSRATRVTGASASCGRGSRTIARATRCAAPPRRPSNPPAARHAPLRLRARSRGSSYLRRQPGDCGDATHRAKPRPRRAPRRSSRSRFPTCAAASLLDAPRIRDQFSTSAPAFTPACAVSAATRRVRRRAATDAFACSSSALLRASRCPRNARSQSGTGGSMGRGFGPRQRTPSRAVMLAPLAPRFVTVTHVSRSPYDFVPGFESLVSATSSNCRDTGAGAPRFVPSCRSSRPSASSSLMRGDSRLSSRRCSHRRGSQQSLSGQLTVVQRPLPVLDQEYSLPSAPSFQRRTPGGRSSRP